MKKFSNETGEMIANCHRLPSLSAVAQECLILCCLEIPPLQRIQIEINIEEFYIEIVLTVDSEGSSPARHEQLFNSKQIIKQIQSLSLLVISLKRNKIFISVRNLFEKVEFRRKLISNKDISALHELIMKLSYWHHNISWELTHSQLLIKNIILSLPCTTSIEAKIQELCPIIRNYQLTRYHIKDIRMKGFFMLPREELSEIDLQAVYINNRWLPPNHFLYSLLNSLYRLSGISEKSLRGPRSMHQKQKSKQQPIFFLQIYCQECHVSIAYTQLHGHAEIFFDNIHDLLHCLYLMIYPLFSSTWINASNNIQERLCFDEEFKKVGYIWDHETHNLSKHEENQESYITDAIKGIEIMENEVLGSCYNPSNQLESADNDLLFQEAFLYPVEVLPSFEPEMQVIEPNENFPQGDCKVRVNKLREGVYETSSNSGIFLEFINERPSRDEIIILDPSPNWLEPQSQGEIGERYVDADADVENEYENEVDDRNEYEDLPSAPIAEPIKTSSEMKIDLDTDFCSHEESFPVLNFQHPSRPINLSKNLFQDIHLKIIGQVDNKYVMVHADGQVLCIDQHAAHERILLEEMEGRLQTMIQDDSILTSSSTDNNNNNNNNYNNEKFKVTNSQVRILNNKKYATFLKTWGFIYSTAQLSVQLASVPIIEGEILTKFDFLEYIDFISKNQSLPMISMKIPAVVRILSSKACRSAIKFGDPLSPSQCQELIQQLAKTSFPFQCAHGRPSIVPLFSFSSPSI